MKFVADKAAPAKQRIVSKKELEDSGLSLRDFLNKERGLTRRKEVDPTAGEARDRAAQIAADSIDPGAPSMESLMSGYKPRRTSTLSEVVMPGTNINYENKDVSDMSMKRGGRVKKMASGGSVGMDKVRDKAMILKAFKQHDAQEHKGGKGTVLKLSSGGSASKRADGIAQRGRTRA